MRPVAAKARRRADRLRRALAARASGPEPHPDLVRLTDEDRRYLTSLHDDSVALPPEANEVLRQDNPRLLDLKERYARLELPVLNASRWNAEAVRSFLDLRYFRGETLITWHYRELPRISALKYFVFARYIGERDPSGLLSRLTEDGAFGCWTFGYSGYGRFSRDLLESVNEIAFLERRLKISEQPSLRVLDVGAGYGRLAHRMLEACPQVEDYCCTDAVPESTFLSEFYLRFRGCTPRGRVVPLDEVGHALKPRHFDLAVNVHSFSECTYAAVEWWMALIERLDVPRLLVVPNEPTELLTLEADGSRLDFRPLIERAGYELEHREPVIEDAAVRELLRLEDQFHMFRRTER